MKQHPYVDLKGREVGEDAYRRVRDQFVARRPCPTCEGDLRYTAPDPADPSRGVEVECDCEEQLARYKHYLAAGIGELWMRLDWHDYRGDPRALEAVRGWMQGFEGLTREGIGLSFEGLFGKGKTMLAMLVAKDLVRRGFDVYATTYSQMIETFAAGWRDVDEQRWFEAKTIASEVLVLDDIGREMGTKVSASTFDHVLRQRVMHLRPTIITTNLRLDNPEAMESRYGGGTLSLLKERSILVSMSDDSRDFRIEAQDRAVGEAAKGWRRPIS